MASTHQFGGYWTDDKLDRLRKYLTAYIRIFTANRWASRYKTTLEALAATKAIDLWLLFPLGQAVNRVLTKDKPPEGGWADRLTRFFGTTEWKEAFYRRSTQMTLFGEEEQIKKDADFEQIGR